MSRRRLLFFASAAASSAAVGGFTLLSAKVELSPFRATPPPPPQPVPTTIPDILPRTNNDRQTAVSGGGTAGSPSSAGTSAGVPSSGAAAAGTAPATASAGVGTTAPADDEALPEQRVLFNVCVFLGSSVGARPEYADAAVRLGEAMAGRGIGLVYGGGSVGLMGVLARTVETRGATVRGFLPELLAPSEVSGDTVGHVTVVPTMHRRKTLMAEGSDAFVALPGGFGTAEELLEQMTWAQLGYHSKPVGILNIGGFFDPLLAQLDLMERERFVSRRFVRAVCVSDDPEKLLDMLQSVAMPAPVVSTTQGRMDAT
eukprot:TRINITY_DN5824_c0_g1_i1.p1 TRINITY_DN5824_c0_g1~~TRINITY_DN5824_c0_g1_i1.p1  ORF type:complete len:314 (+),score=50.02 TRINITY_DN5824_c0_g1_i1:111-1052(+)